MLAEIVSIMQTDRLYLWYLSTVLRLLLGKHLVVQGMWLLYLLLLLFGFVCSSLTLELEAPVTIYKVGLHFCNVIVANYKTFVVNPPQLKCISF